jgi:phosphoserine phosphatase
MPNKQITHVIFDMDGLLLDTEIFYTIAQQVRNSKTAAGAGRPALAGCSTWHPSLSSSWPHADLLSAWLLQKVLDQFNKQFTWDLKAKQMGLKALESAQVGTS